MGKLQFISFAGIDKNTSVKELKKLSNDFNNQDEFGFLFSLSNSYNGENKRYPNPVILKSFKNSGLNLSLHLCGKIVHDLWKYNDWNAVEKELGKYLPLFNRIQLNISADKVPQYIIDSFNKGEWGLTPPPQNQTVILQQGLKPLVWEKWNACIQME